MREDSKWHEALLGPPRPSRVSKEFLSQSRAVPERSPRIEAYEKKGEIEKHSSGRNFIMDPWSLFLYGMGSVQLSARGSGLNKADPLQIWIVFFRVNGVIPYPCKKGLFNTKRNTNAPDILLQHAW
jgi:hypothetical protein